MLLQGRDIHAETSAHLFEVALAAVTHEQRQLGNVLI
jgi:DNA polymerase I-like protein with 3'-5' exonuclease and polymerase domains